MEKHAYLIMAHNNFDLLQKELLLLDDERNDIFIHIDKKVKGVDEAYITQYVKAAKVYFIPRISVNWAAYSGVQCEIDLLKYATKQGKYAYYHLLSGVDLPLKTQDEIHSFFEKEKGKEFVAFDRPVVRTEDIRRVQRYYLFQQLYGRNYKSARYILFYGFDKLFIKVQDLLKVERFPKKTDICLQKGPNWFSITDDLARYVVTQEKWIQKHFKYTKSADEVVIQTIVNSSEYKKRLYQNGLSAKTNACLRKIDWGRGKPYTWTSREYEELIQSSCLFARKFDPGVDAEIIDRIVEYVRKEK